MNTTEHLAAAKSNYRRCVYSLAEQDYKKALSWIIAAIGHVSMCMQAYAADNLTDLYTRKNEYEMLKKAIENGVKRSEKEKKEAFNGECNAVKDDNDEKQQEKPLTFDDVVGLNHAKEAIRGAIVYPFKYKDIYCAFKRKSGGGILLYGAPGTGKTMIAKAIAGEIDAEFISVNCSDIYSKWLGESQQNIKKVFERARKAQRAVIFFDEFEALGRTRNGDSTESGTNSVVCELLAQIDGFCTEGQSNILVIAATNRPWDIDSALRRSGRLERHLYVEMPDEAARIEIIRKQMSNLPTEELVLDEIGRYTDGFSPADVTQLCDLVKDRAIKRSIQSNQISDITQSDFIEVLSTMHSTVNPAELERLKSFV